MLYDFDKPVDRFGTDSIKFDWMLTHKHRSDMLSLWVADMDFPAPQPVLDALQQRVAHGIFGYTDAGPAYFDAVEHWMETRHGWQVHRDQMVLTPGVVFGLAMAVRAFTHVGDAVIIQTPVYYPFSQVVVNNDRVLVEAPLTYNAGYGDGYGCGGRDDDCNAGYGDGGGRYSIDFAAFEKAVVENQVKLFLLCNPHNPVGRAWSAQELQQLGDICLRHGVIVVSDEIHMDFARPGFTHVPFASLSEELAEITVAFTSASKTFNLAGLQTANAIVRNKDLRERLAAEVAKSGYSQPNVLGLVATQAAYEQGEEWLMQLKDYLEGNWALLEQKLTADAPSLKLIPAESTYLAWIDCHALGLDAQQLERFIEDEARLWLDCGHMFGKPGEGFIRVNIATQRSYLQQALDQLCSHLPLVAGAASEEDGCNSASR